MLPLQANEEESKKIIEEYKKVGNLGNENIMGTILKYKDSLKKVVLTSSVSTVNSLCNIFWPCDEMHVPKYGKWSEADFTRDMFSKGMTHTVDWPARSYFIEKATQEDHMMKGLAAIGMPMASIHPTTVFGPIGNAPLSGFSINNQIAMADGTPYDVQGKDLDGQSDIRGMIHVVDIRDVVEAHVLATKPENTGRYVMAAPRYYAGLELHNCLTERIPGLFVDDSLKVMEKVPEALEPLLQFDSSRVEALLGRPLIDWCTTVSEGVLDMLERGLVSNPGWKPSEVCAEDA